VSALIAGLLTGLGLIAAIGAQNVFVLRQGLAKRHAVAVAATATVCDAFLIIAGVAGVGGFVAGVASLARFAAIGGAAFLVVYGVLALRNAVRLEPVDWGVVPASGGSTRLAIGATLAVSLLNPHVYLDTVVLLGGIGGQFPAGERSAFALGAVTASAVWFFGLALGAGALAPLFGRPAARRGADLFVAVVMFSLATFLLRELT
jgi:L-lysine exporter family protein LysE/ArgO